MSPNGSIIEEFVEIGGHNLSMKEIDRLASDPYLLLRYEDMYHGELYSTILISLTHEQYNEDEARDLWLSIIKHKQVLYDKLSRDVGISVASLDYLTNICSGYLKEPIIIENQKSQAVGRVATIDEMTGLYVREVFDVTLMREVERAKRKGQALCLAMIDVDDFKQCNDRFGHLVGDEVLAKVGQCLHESVRDMDLPARYGGEEFAVIMPNTAADSAVSICERVRENVSALNFDCGAQVTVSLGVCLFDCEMDDCKRFVQVADEALYQAKKEGKNRVVSAAHNAIKH